MIELSIFACLMMTVCLGTTAAIYKPLRQLLNDHSNVAISVVLVMVVCLLALQTTNSWPVAIGTGAVGGAIAIEFRRASSRRAELSALAGLADFARLLSDAVGGGSDLFEAIAVASRSASGQIAEPLENLVQALPHIGLEEALRNFSREVNLPAAHLLAAHLIQANKFASGRLWVALRSISEELQTFIEIDQAVASQRFKQEFEIRGLSLVIVFIIAGTFFALPDVIEGLSSGSGFFVIALVGLLVLSAWFLSGRFNRRLSAANFELRAN